MLLVEDNPDVAQATTGLLEQLGYAVRYASDADAALTALEKDDFDLVLSDVVMPGRLNGLDLARTIKNMRPGLPILLVTGYSDSLAKAPPDFQILQKPYEMHELSRAIAAAKRC